MPKVTRTLAINILAFLVLKLFVVNGILYYNGIGSIFSQEKMRKTNQDVQTKLNAIVENSIAKNQEEDTIKNLNYNGFKVWVKEEKERLKQQPLDSTKAFFNQIYQTYIPHFWLGTDWDFNGTTQTPNEGKIACGYFVTNTLDAIGFPVRRVYHAQQASSVIIQALTSNVKCFESADKMLSWIDETYKKDEVFILGLDYHTGFLIKENNTIYFLHSDYIHDEVVKEVALESPNLNGSKSFMVGSITSRNDLIKQWRTK